VPELLYLATLSTNRNYPYCVEPPKEAEVSGVLVPVDYSFTENFANLNKLQKKNIYPIFELKNSKYAQHVAASNTVIPRHSIPVANVTKLFMAVSYEFL
jgi:hypothetical protein